jgi:hypothetical protein
VVFRYFSPNLRGRRGLELGSKSRRRCERLNYNDLTCPFIVRFPALRGVGWIIYGAPSIDNSNDPATQAFKLKRTYRYGMITSIWRHWIFLHCSIGFRQNWSRPRLGNWVFHSSTSRFRVQEPRLDRWKFNICEPSTRHEKGACLP